MIRPDVRTRDTWFDRAIDATDLQSVLAEPEFHHMVTHAWFTSSISSTSNTLPIISDIRSWSSGG